ncbi:MAG: hypothetical protein OEW66_02940 [Actinomycetota bacterium]|nr:hypothetical protein [Actinomycetota bacterium]
MPIRARAAPADEVLTDVGGHRDAPGAQSHVAEEIEYPMGIVILGGLITTTLLNLFVLPSLYLRFGKSRRTYKGDVAPVLPMPA